MKKSLNLRASIRFACCGIKLVFQRERNLRIHFLLAVLIFAAAAWLKIDKVEWLILILTIAVVLGAEIMNSAVEYLVDLSTLEYHHLAKAAKDAAAGAVLVTAMAAVIIGIIIFGPRLLGLFF